MVSVHNARFAPTCTLGAKYLKIGRVPPNLTGNLRLNVPRTSLEIVRLSFKNAGLGWKGQRFASYRTSLEKSGAPGLGWKCTGTFAQIVQTTAIIRHLDLNNTRHISAICALSWVNPLGCGVLPSRGIPEPGWKSIDCACRFNRVTPVEQ